MAALAMQNSEGVRRERHFRGFNPLLRDFSNEELRQRYRFDRNSIQYLANILRPVLERDTRKLYQFSSNLFMIALRFYASGSQLQVIGDTMGFNKSTVSSH